MSASDRETYEEELTRCPQCEGTIELVEKLESNGEGVAFAHITCPECAFSAREEWVHDRTIRKT